MKSREERIENIRKVVEAANKDESIKSYYTIKNWRGKPLYRKIVRIDSEYLMFRIENSRTEIQQLAHIRKNSLPKDFFSDPESPTVQQAQENILTDMVRGKGKDLLDDLKIRKQEDACIISYDGYIVNGNRRTAGLKFLGDRYIDCVVLPEDATPKDIYMLEQQLQIAQDFREKYHWINELRNIRKGKEDARLELSELELAANLRLELKDIKTLLRTLDLVDAFLIWKNITGEYDYPKLDDTEEVFRQLEKAIKKYAKDPAKREALQNAIFNLIEHRPTKGRLYNYVMDLIRNFDQVYVKMQNANTESSEPDQTESKKPEDEETGLLDELIEGESGTETSMFDDPENASETSENLVDVIADVKAENKEKKDAEAVYESVSTALRELQGLMIDNDTAKLGSIRNKLEQIISSSNRLLEELKSFDN
jgi:hypothetical protein